MKYKTLKAPPILVLICQTESEQLPIFPFFHHETLEQIRDRDE